MGILALQRGEDVNSRTKTEYDYIVVGELRLPVVTTVALAGVYLLTQLPSVVESVVLTPQQLDTFFGKPSLSVIILAWAFAANRVVNRLVDEVKDKGSRFDFAPVFSNVWTLVVIVGTVGLLLSIWEYSVSPLLGAAGVAGIAVGFAARDTVANFFGGIALYFDNTYKIGDYITLDSDEAGTVVKVGVRSTTLMMRDGVLITVPNAVLSSAKVINQSAPQLRTRHKIPIGIAYGTDIDRFESLITEIAFAEPLVLDSPKPKMRFRGFGDSALDYELVCWVKSPISVGKTSHRLNRAIYKTLLEHDIEIPYPQRDLNVRRIPEWPLASETVGSENGSGVPSPEDDLAASSGSNPPVGDPSLPRDAADRTPTHTAPDHTPTREIPDR